MPKSWSLFYTLGVSINSAYSKHFSDEGAISSYLGIPENMFVCEIVCLTLIAILFERLDRF